MAGNEIAFFQFPISCLSYPGDHKERIARIISFSIGIYYDKRTAGKPEERREQAGKKLAVKLGSWERTVVLAKQMDLHVVENRERFGRCLEVRIRSSLVFKAQDGRISEREFRILCAIYGSIGGSTYKCIRAEICARLAIGIHNRKSFDAWCHDHDADELLTLRQVRLDWEKLHALGFYAKFTPGRRETFFSNRLTQSELEAKLAKNKTFMRRFKTDATAARLAWRAQQGLTKGSQCPP